ncbi:MAG: UbiA family prenyltransferase, partial [Nitrosarchaeum sp.]|nr:UbiA family prenyltransferase [Nitrosarchaeum sp.]
MIRAYLQLFRIPGIFTVFSNILLGFFIVQDSIIQWVSLVFLLITSGSLFLSGVTLNDFFDYRLDKKERPERPLVSGKIPRKHAFLLGSIFMIIANLFAYFVAIEALVLSLIMSGLILGYNIKLKNIPIVGIFSLSLIRFLNIFLGASQDLPNKEIALIATPLAIFIAGIGILAKHEASISSKYIILNKIFVIMTILLATIIVISNNVSYNLLFLIIFIVLSSLPFAIFNNKSSHDVKKIITIQ